MKDIITQAAFAQKLGIDRQRVGKLIDAGVLSKRPDGKLNYSDSLARAQEYLRVRSEAEQLHSGKAALQAKRLSLQCEKLQLENDQIRGRLHDKTECAQSLTACYSLACHSLMPLHTRIKSQFPELPQAVIEAIAAEVDKAFDQMRAIIPNAPRFSCPHCHKQVEKLEVLE